MEWCIDEWRIDGWMNRSWMSVTEVSYTKLPLTRKGIVSVQGLHVCARNCTRQKQCGNIHKSTSANKCKGQHPTTGFDLFNAETKRTKWQREIVTRCHKQILIYCNPKSHNALCMLTRVHGKVLMRRTACREGTVPTFRVLWVGTPPSHHRKCCRSQEPAQT